MHHGISEADSLVASDMLDDSMDAKQHEPTHLGGYPDFVQEFDQPKGTVLLLEMAESEASTGMWGECGTAQVWMTTGDEFGDFVLQYQSC